MSKSKKMFCIKPWTQGAVLTNGDFAMCCISGERKQYNLKTHSITDWWNSKELLDVRRQMLANQRVSSCEVCYKLEEQGGTSLRQKSNQEYKIFEAYADKMLDYYQYPKNAPVELELQLTNLCNLKCLMCFETDSSSILTENKQLKLSNLSNSLFSVTDSEIEQIKLWLQTKPRLVNFRGGESLMVPEIRKLLEWAVKERLLDDTQVHITTNGTVLTAEWLELLKRIPRLRIMVSVDAVGKLNDYIRFGSNWEVVEKNCQTLSQIPNINFLIHCSIQNLNIMHIDQLISWAKENKFTIGTDYVSVPRFIAINNLPPEYIEQVKHKMLGINSDVSNQISERLTMLDPFNKQLWESFCEYITIKDTHRHVSILDVIPELAPYWNK